MEVNALFQDSLQVINVGVERFSDAVRLQEIPVVQMDFTPPAGGDERLIRILDRLEVL